jgi:cell division protein FtsX
MMDNYEKFIALAFMIITGIIIGTLAGFAALSAAANDQCVILGYDMGMAEGFKQICKNIEVIPLNEAISGGR